MPAEQPWWQTGVVYQIYPRSFQDSNGDGSGDLPGVITRLDYLQDLGVDALWLSPVFSSPMVDLGYDVSNYKEIDPLFGTMADFRRLLQEAHRRGMRVILDMVPNHTSDQHRWFVESASSRENPKRDWYIWHDGKNGMPPNNWRSAFGGRAWSWHAPTQQYYLHSFAPEQPDVNWRNPALAAAMADIMRFWLDQGVDGFRLDVINRLIKDAFLRDNPLHIHGPRPYDWQAHVYDRNRPETLHIVRQIRRLVDSYPERVTVGEVFEEPAGDPALAANYYLGGEGLHLVFNFAFLHTPWNAAAFQTAIAEWDGLLGSDLWPTYTFNNHDQPRSFSRYGSDLGRAQVAAAMLLTLRGTPFLYYGEEIGMRDGRIPRHRLQDPAGKRYWPLHPGRDPERTPMQWHAGTYAGFSNREPWLPVNDDYGRVNVAAQDAVPSSLLQWYRRLLRLRREHPALHKGDYHRLPGGADGLAYLRSTTTETILVLLNFAHQARLAPMPQGYWQVVLSNQLTTGQQLTAPHVWLPGDTAVIASLGGAQS